MKRRSSSSQQSTSKRSNKNLKISLVEAVKDKKSVLVIQKILKLKECSTLEERLEDKTALMWALKNGDLEVAKLLVSAGANLKAKGSNGLTVLMYAVWHTSDSRDFIEELVEKCHNLEEKTRSGFTAFLIACKVGNPFMVQTLLDIGASLEDRTKHEDTPLILATLKGNVETIQILLQAGASTEDTNKAGETAVFHVQNEESLAVLLQAGANPCVLNKIKTPVIVYIAQRYFGNNLVNFLNLLLKAGADPSSQNDEGVSVLMYVVSRRDEQTESVKLLLESGVNPSHEDDRGHYSALSKAIKHGHFESVKLLIEAGANPSTQDFAPAYSLLINVCKKEEGAFGETPILEVLRYLIDSGADVSPRDRFQLTALIYAVQSKNVDLVKCLLSAGADVSYETLLYRHSALSAAIELGSEHSDILDLIVNSSVNTSSAHNFAGKIHTLHYALNHKRTGLIEKLFKHPGYNIRAQNLNGTNILMVACLQSKHNKVVRYLIENGAHLSAQDDKGKTALMHAFEKQNFIIVELLIESGAKISTQDKSGNTLLMMACRKGNLKIVKLLLEKGVSLLIKNNEGETAAMIAASNDRLDILSLLLEHGASAENKDKNENSVLSHLVNNRMTTKLRSNHDQILNKIVCYHDFDNVALVLEAVRVYLNTYTNSNHIELFSFMEPFIYYNLRTAKINDVSNFLVRKIFGMVIQGYDNVNGRLRYFYFESRKNIFDMIIESKFKYLNWTCTRLYIELCEAFDPMISHNFSIESMGFILYMHHDEHKGEIDQNCFKFYSELIKNLVANGFPVKPNDPNVMSPLSVLCAFRKFYELDDDVEYLREKYIVRLAKRLIRYGAEKCQHLLRFKDPALETLRRRLLLPDALWFAFQCGYSLLLPVLLPYWSAPPLALFMFLPSMDDLYGNELMEDFDYHLFETGLNDCLDELVDISGPLPPGNEFIEPIQNYLDGYAARRADVVHQQAATIAERFRSLHEGNVPPSLKSMCRYVIRGCSRTSGDLPQRLSSLVPFGLKKFISLRK